MVSSMKKIKLTTRYNRNIVEIDVKTVLFHPPSFQRKTIFKRALSLNEVNVCFMRHRIKYRFVCRDIVVN
jgi:hypothetical protein